MEIYDLTVTCIVNDKDIYYQDAQERVGKFIHNAMLLDNPLTTLHKEKGIKNYSYSSFYPVETKTKVYKAGNVYVFRIRSLSKEFISRMRECLKKSKRNTVHVIATEVRTISNRIIESVYTVTPVIVTVDNGPWMQTDDLDLFIERISINLKKKYRQRFQKELESDNFITNLEFMNHKPIATNYKGIKLLGHKVKIDVDSNKDSQKLAYTALGSGLGEKNSVLGSGFCMARFI